MRALTLLFASSILLAGCPTRNQLQGNNDGSMSDGDGSTPPPPNTVSITSPTATTTYTNGSVSIVVSTQNPTTTPISIVASGTTTATIGTVTAPQTSFNWNTTSALEGTYSVTAQLTSNGKTVTSNAVTIVVDRTPPQVVVSSLVPAPGAADVVLAAPLVVVFSEPVLASTVTANLATVLAGVSYLPTSVALSSDGKTATIAITSHANITLPLSFSATLASTVTDLAGNQLAALTTPWNWSVPDWIKLAPFNSSGPPLFAVGADFNPVLGYAVCGGSTGGGSSCTDVLHVAVGNGQAWNDLGAVDPSATPSFASVAVDSQNHPIAAWGFQTTAAVGEVLFASWTGSAWDNTTIPPIVLPASEGSSVDRVVLRLTPTGYPVVAYRANTTSASDIYVASWTGTAWDTVYGAVGAPGSTSFDLILNDQGNPVVAVVATNIDGAFVWGGTSWMGNNRLGTANAFVALDSSGNPVMLNTSGMWLPDHLTNGTWLPTVSSPVPASSTARDPNITNTPDRLPAVAWYDPSVTPHELGVARWTGTAWDNRAGLAYEIFGPEDEPPSLVVDARGSLWLAWFENLQANVWMSNY